jgi:hypothetical protein
MAITSPLLLVHVGMGTVAILAGAAALSLRKGSPLHRRAGNVFFVSMLVMSTLGAYLAFARSDMGTTLAGVLSVYVVSTAWMTVIRKENESGRFEILALLVVSAVAAAALAFGLEAAASETGAKDGYAAGFYYFVAGLASFIAALDVRFIWRGGLAGTQRLVRHLWRMCYGMFIATGSLFLGQQEVFPERLRGTLVLAAPVILVLGTMLYWLVLVQIAARRMKRRPVRVRRALGAVDARPAAAGRGLPGGRP